MEASQHTMNPQMHHGGEVALEALSSTGISEMFTLSGAHVFPLYDAAVKLGWPIIDVRHEQSAVFAAEAMAKLTRRPGLAVVTAGPGVTNSISALTTAFFNGSPLLLLAGRASQATWGMGTLQEMDHLPLVTPVTKFARTAMSAQEIRPMVHAAVQAATTRHRGPAFLDFPLEVIFGNVSATNREDEHPSREDLASLADNAQSAVGELDQEALTRLAKAISESKCPVVFAGSDVWWNGAENALVRFVERFRLPVFTNGLGRGTIPASHELAFSRSRPVTKEADLVVVIGTPLDFRLSFGRFGAARVAHLVDDEALLSDRCEQTLSLSGDLATILDLLASMDGLPRADHEEWITRLAQQEGVARAQERERLESSAQPIVPSRVYGELRKILDDDAIVIGDGGDFVSYAGRYLDFERPGCFLEPGPFGCLGTGLGYSMAARVAYPDRQVVLCAGDGAFGMSAMDVDTLVRHHLPVVIVIGNNSAWGLEKHPMRQLYGYDVAAELQPECRYDEVVKALGGAGEIVRDPEDLSTALKRALDAGVPYVVNVITDPQDAYPRRSSLV